MTTHWISRPKTTLTILALSISMSNAYATPATGLAWLQQAVNSSGGVSGEAASVATILQARSEASATLKALGFASSINASSLPSDELSTESVARAIVIDKATGADPTAHISTLNALQNTDGGFGHLGGWQSNPLDTAFALIALNGATDSTSISAQQNAIAYLGTQQHPDGSFQTSSSDPLYTSGYVLTALGGYIRTNPIVVPTISNLTSYLLQKQLSPGQWYSDSELYLDALLNFATYDFQTSPASASAFAARAIGLQSSDGSWGEDPYTTSVVLRALQKQNSPAANPLTASLSLTVLDTESSTPLANVQLTTTSGSASQPAAISSDSNGKVLLQGLKPGTYTFSLSESGYVTASFIVTVKSGDSINLGKVQLTRSTNTPSGLVSGSVTDIATGLPLSGATITVVGSTQSAQSAADGTFNLILPSTGDFTLNVTEPGYVPFQIPVTSQGMTISVIAPMHTPPSYTASVQGIVVDGSGAPLSGVLVQSGGTTIGTTDATGAFTVSNVATGQQSLTLSKPNYANQNLSAALSTGSTFNVGTVTMQDAANASAGSGSLVVSVQDNKGQAIAGAVITAEMYGQQSKIVQTQSFTTTAGNNNVTLPLPVGNWRITVSALGYDYLYPVGEDIHSGQQLSYTALLVKQGYSIVGTVVDAQSNLPIANVPLLMTGFFAGVRQDVYYGNTNAFGQFSIPSGTASANEITFKPDGYASSTRLLAENALSGQSVNLGQVRLRPNLAARTAPDLYVSAISTAGVTTDPQALTVNGTVVATIGNQGTALSSGNLIPVTAFYDLNHNHKLDANDPIIGEGQIQGNLGNTQTTDVSINITGKTSFRDQPISIMVDRVNQSGEFNRNNNVASTSDGVKAPPVPAGPLPIKTLWTAPFTSNAIAAAAPLTDTNGDGKIDEDDDASIVIQTTDPDYSNFNPNNPYVVLNSKTGAVQFTIPGESTGPSTGTPYLWSQETAAIGVLDPNSSLPEIAVNTPKGLKIYSNTGTLLKEFDVANSYCCSGYASNPVHPLIADLNGDGVKEIVVGGNIYSYPQGLIATGMKSGLSQAAVDVNGDGFPEIIGLDGVSDHNGNFLYNYQWDPKSANAGQAVHLMFLAVGDVLGNHKPQIVGLDTSGIIYVIDGATGYVINSFNSPYNGPGGTPTIVDLDGDGVSDIVISGSYFITGIHGDGSVIWMTRTLDESGGTGSTTFDFGGKGLPDVIYYDEEYLYILDGRTGVPRVQIDNDANTGHDHPIVLNVNGHASIFMVGHHDGLRLLTGANNDWSPTRNVWNQYSYHATNVNDDVTIPNHETNFWEQDNTFRVNPRLNILAKDPTASFIQVQDGGASSASTFTVRVGNAGGKTINAGLPVSFYKGDPTNGGVLLGTTFTTNLLVAGAYQDVSFSYTADLSSFGTLYAVVNDAGTGPTSAVVAESTSANNTASLAIASGHQNLTLAANVDKTSYAPTDTVTISATATNQGSFSSNSTVRFTILDSVGNVVATLSDQTLTLAPQAAQAVTAAWPVASSRVGAYTVRTDLIQQGAVVASLTTPFQIGSDAASTGLTSTSLSVDKQNYSASDTVTISEHIQNTSTNTVGGPVTVVTSVLNPDGSTRWTQSATYPQLVPQQLQQQSYQLPLANAPAGTYTVTTSTTAAGQAPYTSQATFAVLSSSQTGTGLKGSLTGAASVLAGSAESFNWNISNNGNAALSNVPVRIIVIDPATGALVTTVTSSTQTLAQSSSLAPQITNWLSNGPSNTPLVAVLQIQNSTGNWQTLAQQPLTVVLPPVSIVLSTDKPSYNIQQNAVISITDTNQSTATLSGATSKTVITAPNGTVFKTENATQATWAAGAVWTQSYTEALGRAQAGTWTVVHTVYLANGTVLKTQTASFTVASTALTGLGLQGTLAATPAQVPLGQTVALNLQVVNQGNADLANLPLTVGLYKNGATTATQTFNYNVPTLAQTTTAQQAFTWTPTGAVNDQYSAVLRSSVGGQSNTLALASFSLLPPPVSVTFPTSPSGANNVLVYYSCQPGWFSGLLGWTLGVYTNSCFNDRATVLKSYLDSLGVNYTLTYVPSQFNKLMRSGKYNNFWVLGAVEKITENTNDELRELVNDGSPVVFDSGLYSWLNYELYSLVDVSYRGHVNLHDTSITPTAPTYTPSTLLGQPQAAAWPLLVKPGSHTTVTATYSASQCTVDRDWITSLESLPDLLFYGTPVSTYPAIVTSSYGLSKPIGLTFDLISSLSQASATPTAKASWQELLKQTLAATQVDTTQRTSYVPSELITLPLSLKNQGPATPVTILVELPTGAVWQGTGTPDASNRVVINQTLTANATQTIPLSLRLPTTSGSQSVRLSVYNGTLSSPITATAIATQQLSYSVVDIPTRLSSVRSAVSGWSIFSLDATYIIAAQTQMSIAQTNMNSGHDDLAIAALAEAGEQIAQMTHTSNSAATRLALDDLMRAVHYRWYLQQTP